MPNKREFTSGEAAHIRDLLEERPRTKATRGKLRRIGFYISDFTVAGPFSTADFDRLLATRQILITDPVNAGSLGTGAGPRSLPSAIDSVDIEAVRQRYRPLRIQHLLVGESPPKSGRFFYFANSTLFHQTRRAFCAVFGDVCGDGETFLRFFQNQGFFLDDLCAKPVNGMKRAERRRERAGGIHSLATRIAAAKPRTLIIVMNAIVPEVRAACEMAGIAPTVIELPFPVRVRQPEFLAGMVAFLRTHTSAAGRTAGAEHRNSTPHPRS
jgi:hypothetical protein